MENIEGFSQIISRQEIPKMDMPETESTSEQKEIIESAIKFAEYLTDRWPQIDSNRRPIIEIDDEGASVELPELPETIETEPRLNYYFSGSLATMLLSRAERFYEMNMTQTSTLAEFSSKEIPESAREKLASFARQIGDIDYVPTAHYKEGISRVRDSLGKVSEEEYRQRWSKYLRKGGGGPSFNEVPEEGRKVLKRSENQIKVMCDPVESHGASRVAKVSVEGQDYYIARPDTILAYKVLHLLQNYETKPEKFNTDFSKLQNALKEIYSESELKQITQQVLMDFENNMGRLHTRLNKDKEYPPAYEKKIPAFITRVLANQQVSTEIRTTLESLREQ